MCGYDYCAKKHEKLLIKHIQYHNVHVLTVKRDDATDSECKFDVIIVHHRPHRGIKRCSNEQTSGSDLKT